MATEYTITYTKTNQNNKKLGTTPQTQTIGIGGFTISGDTNRVIGKIKSITFKHTNSATTGYSGWRFYPKLNFSDGTSFSLPSAEGNFRADTVTMTHTASNELPTVNQIMSIVSIYQSCKQTYGNDGAELYWRADAGAPMKIIIKFEEAPIYYGINGEWKTCQIYYGLNGQWVQAIPYYGINGEWKQV